MNRSSLRAARLAAASVLFLAGCGGFGRVEQGLVVASGGDELTLILDSNPGGAPRYDRVPPARVRIPADPSQMGPAPDPGKLVDLDTAAGQATIFDASAGKLVKVPFTVIERAGNVYPDDRRVRGRRLPRVDAAARRVTLYSHRTLELVTIEAPAEFLSLPEDSWKMGDEVRYYFKQPDQALRMMNVSDTKIG